MNRGRTDIIIRPTGESTLRVGKQTAGETTGFHPSTDDNFAAIFGSLERTPSNKLSIRIFLVKLCVYELSFLPWASLGF